MPDLTATLAAAVRAKMHEGNITQAQLDVPTAEQMASLNAEQVFEQNPELARLRMRFGRVMITGVGDMPDPMPLQRTWGAPDGWRLSWWNLMPFVLIPPFHPMTTWRWDDVGGKRIDAIVDHPLIAGYGPKIWMIKVRDGGVAIGQ